MSVGNEEVDIRRARLRALRERYSQAEPLPAVALPLDGAGAEEAPPAAVERLPTPARQRAGAPKSKQRTGQQGSGGLLQRAAAFLTQQGPGAKFIAGTPIREDRLGQLVQFLKRRGAAANGPQAQRARSILAYLTEVVPGESMREGVNIGRAAALVKRAKTSSFPDNQPLIAVSAEAGVVEDDVLTAAAALEESESLSVLVKQAQRLSEELVEVHKRIAQQLQDRMEAQATAVNAPVSRTWEHLTSPVPGATPPVAKKTDGEWYIDFLD